MSGRGLQVLALSYGRAAVCYSSRYLDVICVGLVINFAAILFLLKKSDGLFKHVCFIVSAFWFLGFGVGLYQHRNSISRPKQVDEVVE